MAIQYQGLSGKIYYVEEKIGGGGEGAIHRILDNDRQVVKIFRPEKRSAEREEKLRHMVQYTLQQEQLEEVTWPQDVLYNQGGFVGYVMPRLNNTSSLTALYSTGGRGKYDLRYRLLAAINLCNAIKTVHDMGQVCGDLNPQNICINLDVTNPLTAFHVTLVDTDSYHFTSGGKTYRCEVGLADYLAPEIQNKVANGVTLRNAPLPTYTKETDLFALAVHIFALLMNGCHPFACAKDINGTYENTMAQMEAGQTRDSVVAPQPIENIKEGFFPFFHQRAGITYPIYAPSFDSLPQAVQKLFIRTFVDGYQNPALRADAEEWIRVLMQVKNDIKACSANPEHYYFGHRASCPLCDAQTRIRRMFDPPIQPTEEIEEERQTEWIKPEETIQPGATVKTEERVNKPIAGAVFMIVASFMLLLSITQTYGLFNGIQIIASFVVYGLMMASAIVLLASGKKKVSGCLLMLSSLYMLLDGVGPSLANDETRGVAVACAVLGIVLVWTSDHIPKNMKATWFIWGVFAGTTMAGINQFEYYGYEFEAMVLLVMGKVCLVGAVFAISYWTTHTENKKRRI